MINYICYIFDENYMRHGAASILSLIDNNKDVELEIFALTIDISENDRKLVAGIGNEMQKVTVIDISGYKKDFDGIERSWSLGTYARLIIHKILPKYVNRVLYIDCDTLVLNSLKQLFDTDMRGNTIAAVIDKLLPKGVKASIGIDDSKPYINAGVMLIDLKKWKDKKVGERCIQFLRDNAKANNIPDQNAINYVLKDDIELISLRYNVDGIMPYLPYKNAKKLFTQNVENFYSVEDYEESRINPVIVHFIGFYLGKPWRYDNLHIYAKQYEEYAKQTPFGFKLEKKAVSGDAVSKIIRKTARNLIAKSIQRDNYRKFVRTYKLSEDILHFGSKIKRMIKK